MYFLKNTIYGTLPNNTVSIFIPDLRCGGTERVAVNLANSFIGSGYAVDMILVSQEGDFLSELHSSIRIVNLQATRLIGSFLPLSAYLQKAQPDALLACMWPMTVIAVWAKFLSQVKTRIVVSEHTTWSHSELIQRRCVKWQAQASMHCTFPYADAVVSVSTGAADDLSIFSNIKRDKISVIYNPVVGRRKCDFYNWSEFYKIEKWQKKNNTRKILAVGKLKKDKGFDILLKSIAILCKYKNVCLLIAGEGECRGDLERQAVELGISNNTFFPGYIKNVSLCYQLADLYVLSSIVEGLSMVIIEALSFGLPVVSTDCPSGPREILMDGKYGKLVPVGDAEAMAEAIADSLSSQHDRDALKARAQDFSIDKAADSYLKLLFPDSQRNDNYEK
jgi:glycosyltransferase involved in cell wall biosynthesis